MIGTTEEEKKKLKDRVRTIVEEELLKDEKFAKDVLHLQKYMEKLHLLVN